MGIFFRQKLFGKTPQACFQVLEKLQFLQVPVWIMIQTLKLINKEHNIFLEINKDMKPLLSWKKQELKGIGKMQNLILQNPQKRNTIEAGHIVVYEDVIPGKAEKKLASLRQGEIVMSCEELAMFCSIIAYTPHIRQNHSILTYLTKNYINKLSHLKCKV